MHGEFHQQTSADVALYAEPKPETFLDYTFAALQELQEMQTIHFLLSAWHRLGQIKK